MSPTPWRKKLRNLGFWWKIEEAEKKNWWSGMSTVAMGDIPC